MDPDKLTTMKSFLLIVSVFAICMSSAAQTTDRDQIERAHTHANTPLVDLPTGSAIVRRDDAWEIVGDAVVHGELPTMV